MRQVARIVVVPSLVVAALLGSTALLRGPEVEPPDAVAPGRPTGATAAAQDAAVGAGTPGACARPTLKAAPTRPRGGASAGPAYPRRTLSHLRAARGWTEFLRTWHGLPEAADGEARCERLDAALAGLEDPVVRQNVIFAAVLLLPWAEAGPWLEKRRSSGDAQDAEDALCALAFRGDAAAAAAFRTLANQPSSAQVRRVMDSPEAHDALAARGDLAAREVLRSYRSIEALDARPYFHMLPYLVTHDWSGEGSKARLGFEPAAALSAREREALLEAWLARYPGHPGTDGMSLRVARLRTQAGDAAGASRWFARALGGPDQDRAHRAQAPLVALVERLLGRDELAWLAEAEGLDTPSRGLYRYAHLRRTAVEVGFARACRDAEALGAREPDGMLGAAWNARLASPPPRGLTSGLAPLPPTDPLLRTTNAPPAPQAGAEHTSALGARWNGWSAEARLAPARDPWTLDPHRLSRQLRAWEALAELERRAEAAHGVARADLLYKQAALLYHDRDATFPCYARHTGDFHAALGALDGEDGLPAADAAAATSLEEYAARAFAWERALAVFERIEREHPDYPGMDKVLFSAGLCLKRLVDYRPRGAWSYGGVGPQEAPRDDPSAQAIRRCAETFERVAREHPTSPLADDAARAAAWWRRARPQAFAAAPASR